MKKIKGMLSGWIIAIVVMSATVGLITSLNSCATLNALAGLTRAQFKLQDAVNVNLVGINLSGKRSLSDLSVMDALNLTKAFAANSFPLTFTLNVAMKNPNNPDPNVNFSNYNLTSFPWRLFIDGRETISGGIGKAVTLPNPGTTTTIPLAVSLDLKKFFADKGYEDVANLAMAISGGGTSRLTLKAQPTLGSPLGSIKYPNEVQIVSTEFRN